MNPRHEIDTPAYVISSDGFKLTVTYKDDWYYSRSAWLGTVVEEDAARELIKTHIRAKPVERNGLPIYDVDDHGGISRRRAIRLRRLA